MLDKSFLIKNGYLIVDLQSYDSELYSELYNIFDKNVARNHILYLRCDASTHNPDHLNLNITTLFEQLEIPPPSDIKLHTYDGLQHHFHSNIDFPNHQSIKDVFLNNTNAIKQIWGHGAILSRSPYFTITDKINRKLTDELYINQTEPNISLSSDLTLYTNGCFIEKHNDGIDPNRLCVILIYLNKDWIPEYGGEIALANGTIVTPTFGKVVILDFTHNNINHGVNVVNGEFERFAFIKFIYKNLEM